MINLYLRLIKLNRKGSGERLLNWDKHIPITENKSIEIQLARFRAFEVLNIDFNTYFTGSDHAGPELTISVFGWFFGVGFKDRRHWDDEKGTWEEPVYYKDTGEFDLIIENDKPSISARMAMSNELMRLADLEKTNMDRKTDLTGYALVISLMTDDAFEARFESISKNFDRLTEAYQ